MQTNFYFFPHCSLSHNLLRDEGVKCFVDYLPKLKISSSVRLEFSHSLSSLTFVACNWHYGFIYHIKLTYCTPTQHQWQPNDSSRCAGSGQLNEYLWKSCCCWSQVMANALTLPFVAHFSLTWTMIGLQKSFFSVILRSFLATVYAFLFFSLGVEDQSLIHFVQEHVNGKTLR